MNLSIRKISVKAHSGKSLLQETSFDLPLGLILGVYGPNGAGKSSLLKTLSGLSAHENIVGETWIGNSLISREMPTAERVRSIVYLGSDFISPFELTVRDLLEMGALVHSSELWPTLSAKERAQMGEVVESLGLIDFLPRIVSTLSDGEKQLVMFARCLIQAPKVLVLDESFSKLDLDKLLLLTRVIRRRAAQGQTFLIAAHDLNFLSEVLTTAMLESIYPDRAIHVVKSPETGRNKILY
jgi:iron complex transport system ATP-binding protein